MVELISFPAMHSWPKFEKAVFIIAIETVEDVCRVYGELPKVREEALPKLGLPRYHHVHIAMTLDQTLLDIEFNALSDRLKRRMPAESFRSELEELNKRLIPWRHKVKSDVEDYLEEAEARLTKMA